MNKEVESKLKQTQSIQIFFLKICDSSNSLSNYNLMISDKKANNQKTWILYQIYIHKRGLKTNSKWQGNNVMQINLILFAILNICNILRLDYSDQRKKTK